MKCPDCQSTMSAKKRNGVELDWCRGCPSLWFDPGELEIASLQSVDPSSVARFRPSELTHRQEMPPAVQATSSSGWSLRDTTHGAVQRLHRPLGDHAELARGTSRPGQAGGQISTNRAPTLHRRRPRLIRRPRCRGPTRRHLRSDRRHRLVAATYFEGSSSTSQTPSERPLTSSSNRCCPG